MSNKYLKSGMIASEQSNHIGEYKGIGTSIQELAIAIKFQTRWVYKLCFYKFEFRPNRIGKKQTIGTYIKRLAIVIEARTRCAYEL